LSSLGLRYEAVLGLSPPLPLYLTLLSPAF